MLQIDSRQCGLVDAVKTGWYDLKNGELLQGFPIREEDVVFDFGCGNGAAITFCANQGASVAFADVDKDKIEKLESSLTETKARAVRSFADCSLPLPIENEFASRVISMEVLEHVDDPAQVIRELVRIGKPDAQYLLTVPAAQGEAFQQDFAPKSYYEHPNHVRIFSESDFKSLVTDNGLQLEQYSVGGFYWTLWMTFYWVVQQHLGAKVSGAVLDKITPPYHPLLDSWASTWHQLLQLPEGDSLREKLDGMLPKTQVILARKAG